MPPAGALIAAAVAGGLTAAAGVTLFGLSVTASAFLTAAASLALSTIQSALAKKQKFPNFASFDARASENRVLIRQPITARRVVIGEVRVSGPVVFLESTKNNRFHHVVIPLSDGECERISTVFFEDVAIFEGDLDAAGNVVSGKFAGKARIKKHLGAPNQVADPDLVTEVTAWTNNHVGRGVTYIYVRVETDRALFPAILPRNITAHVYGRKLFDVRDSTTAWSPNAALAVRWYLTDTRIGRGAAADEIDDTFTIAAANICDQFVDTQAVAHEVLAVDAGADTVEVNGDRLKIQTGDRVQVTTTGTVPAGLALLTDYYVIVHQEVKPNKIKLAASYDDALAFTAIDITGAGTGTHTVIKNGEPRYTANGVVDSSRTGGAILDDLLTALAGFAPHQGGAWRIYAGAWMPSGITFDEGDLRGPFRRIGKRSRRVKFNAVKGTYVSPLNGGVPNDYPAVTSPTFEAEDGGERIFGELDLPFTSRSNAAQRLAKIRLLRHRTGQTRVETRFSMAGMQVHAAETVGLDNGPRGWTDRPFFVDELAMAVVEGDGGNMIVVDMALSAISANDFVFDPNTEETVPDPAPLVNPLDPSTVIPPTDLVLTSGNAVLFEKADGTIGSRIRADWTASVDKYVDDYLVEFKKSADGVWQPGPPTQGQTFALIWDVTDLVAYDVRVWAVNQLGVRAATPLTKTGHVVLGKSDPPPPPDTYTITVDADGTRRHEWTLADVPADVRVGGGYRIRWFLGSTSDWGAMAPMHTGLLTSSPWESNQLAAGTYTLAIKTVDSSGNESTTARFISSAALGDPRIANALVQQNERTAGWPGTKTDGFVAHDGTLQATSSGTWNDLPATWSAMAATWAAVVVRNSPMVYTTATIDLGLDINFRPLVTAAGSGTHALTMQVGTAADGAPVGAFVAPAVVTARYIKIRDTVTGTTPSIETLVTILDAPAKDETYEDVAVATAADVWFERLAAGHFRIETRGGINAITQARINAIQNVGAGWTWELITKTTTLTGHSLPAAEFKVYNGGGVLADATVDVILRGAKAG